LTLTPQKKRIINKVQKGHTAERQSAFSTPRRWEEQGAELCTNFLQTNPTKVDGLQAAAPEKGEGARS
jgi:hypothetical protein